MGCSKTIEYVKSTECDTCQGSGKKDSSKTKQCRTCKGSGRMSRSVGGMYYYSTCPECSGIGKTNLENCSQCRGSGATSSRVTQTINIPSGVTEEQILGVRGAGHTTNSRTGTLNLSFEVLSFFASSHKYT